ncbi:MAG TPA: tetratricopeptide repeat protein [Verrucomicrobiales bacterium]|jgi:tetratricopeptide (TPR) repeat protein|nr:tetratricopeptide repeat protein [Verrucomicrobiales bacterium]
MPFVFRCLLLLTVLFTATPGRAVTLEEANAFFKAKDYAKAAAACEDLIKSEGVTASRLYNLGNARFELHEYGPAILAYERAALLAPRDPDILANLKLARKTTASYEEAPSRPWHEAALYGLSLHEWSWAAIAGAVLPALALLVWGIAGFPRPWVKRAVIGSIVLGILSGSLAGYALWYRRAETKLGIITAAEPVLRLSPFAEAGAAGSPGTGRRVELGEHHNGWVYVTVSGSTIFKGWLPEKDAPPLMVAE